MGDNSIVAIVAAVSTNLCVSDSIPGTGSNTWIIDIGAFDHMTYDAKFFDELSSNTRDPYITSANGLPSPIFGEGTISLTPTLSLSQDLKTHDMIGHGHPSFGYLKRLFPSLFRSCDESSFKCETCILAKSHRTVFPLSDSKAAKPFNLVHYDVWGPACVTSNGFRWFVTFIDDCTRLTWVFLLKNKHDVASILLEFYTMVSTQFHAQVKVFRTDNRGEYVNNTLASFFLAQGIIHQTTTPFTPQQNDVSGHAIFSAAYLINHTPSRVLDFKTPHDVFGDHISPISISKLPPKVLGCVSYVHFYSHQRSKLDPVLCDVSLLVILLLRKGERGSELESLGLENDVFKDTALRKETTCRTEASDRLPIIEDETCGPYEETSDHPLELDQLPISGDEAGAFGVETTGHTEASVPTKLQDALSNPKWMDAMNVEMNALNKNKTWDLVPLPRWKKALECIWVFTLKHKANSSIDRYKARLVVKGYTQTYGVDYLETFVLLAKLNTVRVLLSLAANCD
ncbi:unnamed protein product [Prunus armeniaca]